MANSSVMPNVPTTAEPAVPAKLPKMLLFLGFINGLLILMSVILKFYDDLMGPERHANGEIDLEFINEWILVQIFFYAIPVALLYGFLRGFQPVWEVYRFFGWFGGLYFLLTFTAVTLGVLIGRNTLLKHLESDDFSRIIYSAFLITTYLWLNSASARQHFGMRPKNKRLTLLQ